MPTSTLSPTQQLLEKLRQAFVYEKIFRQLQAN